MRSPIVRAIAYCVRAELACTAELIYRGPAQKPFDFQRGGAYHFIVPSFVDDVVMRFSELDGSTFPKGRTRAIGIFA